MTAMDRGSSDIIEENFFLGLFCLFVKEKRWADYKTPKSQRWTMIWKQTRPVLELLGHWAWDYFLWKYSGLLWMQQNRRVQWQWCGRWTPTWESIPGNARTSLKNQDNQLQLAISLSTPNKERGFEFNIKQRTRQWIKKLLKSRCNAAILKVKIKIDSWPFSYRPLIYCRVFFRDCVFWDGIFTAISQKNTLSWNK